MLRLAGESLKWNLRKRRTKDNIQHRPQKSWISVQPTSCRWKWGRQAPWRHNRGRPARPRDTPPALRPLPTYPADLGRVLGLGWGQICLSWVVINRSKNQAVILKRWTHLVVWRGSLALPSRWWWPSSPPGPCTISLQGWRPEGCASWNPGSRARCRLRCWPAGGCRRYSF